ncbi:MAG: L-serine ammonia-lyase [Verrucomicrobiales bacterium]|nr:L-serine ammonia-lyase [Verrucomicrobiales bacterium]
MSFSILDFFTIGIGPSSSHTVGPMRAAARFARSLDGKPVERVRCDLFGSLAATGKGHGTHHAILLGLSGAEPESVELDLIPEKLEAIRSGQKLTLPDGRDIKFVEKEDLIYHRGQTLPRHSNAMHFTARDEEDNILSEKIFYSTGGGFIVSDEDWDSSGKNSGESGWLYHFDTAAELLEHCKETGLSIADLVLANETVNCSEARVRARLDAIWLAMQECVERGCRATGVLPGGLHVKRRAGPLLASLEKDYPSNSDAFSQLDWVNLYALAVNEENAAGGRVVTAPTNGAAGIIPAVLHYANRFTTSPHKDPVHRFLLTAGAIALLYKKGASLSGADVGCQGEVGVACSMAAGGLADWLGGTVKQIECAAEIGMEHNLGLTCDPVGGLVQIPCIERNAMGAVKAINAARLALSGDGSHIVSLDKVIKTMRDTGRDMMAKYKETSRGGLAVNVVEC